MSETKQETGAPRQDPAKNSGQGLERGRSAAAPGVDGWFEGRVHVRPVRVYYEDTDFSGVVYHGDYVRFFERGRSDFLRLAGVHHAELAARDDAVVFALTGMNMRFRRPAHIDDLLQVRTTYDSIRGARLFISQEIRRDEAVLVTADVEAVSLSLEGRPKRLPADIIEKVGSFLAAES